jgi:hypothetical protein
VIASAPAQTQRVPDLVVHAARQQVTRHVVIDGDCLFSPGLPDVSNRSSRPHIRISNVLGMKQCVIAVLLAGCNSQGTAHDADATDAATLETSIAPLPDDVCVVADPNQQLESECCLEPARRQPHTNAATVIDLRDAATIADATCGHYESGFGYKLPVEPAAYPVKVILPAVTARDPACEVTCRTDGVSGTAFGIGIHTEPALLGHNGYGMAIYVPPPWKFVSGGCGEACAWPCLEQYQEFGVRSCVTIFYGSFGFATADANAPSVEAIIELIDMPADTSSLGESQCCLLE